MCRNEWVAILNFCSLICASISQQRPSSMMSWETFWIPLSPLVSFLSVNSISTCWPESSKTETRKPPKHMSVRCAKWEVWSSCELFWILLSSTAGQLPHTLLQPHHSDGPVMLCSCVLSQFQTVQPDSCIQLLAEVVESPLHRSPSPFAELQVCFESHTHTQL